MARYLYSELAQLIDARARCKRDANTEWFDNHSDTITYFEKNLLPSGSGFDSGTKVDLERSQANKLVLTTSFHHMHESGMYDGWTEHTITITPSLAHKFYMRISGRNRNDIKELIAQEFELALNSDVEFEVYQRTFDITWETRAKDRYSMGEYFGIVNHADGTRYQTDGSMNLDSIKSAVVEYVKSHTDQVRRNS